MPSPYIYQADTFSANGNSTAVQLKGAINDITVYFGAGVTFGSGTLTGQISTDGGTTWIACVDAISITSATASTVKATYRVYGEGKFRLALTGSTTPTLNVAIKVEQVEGLQSPRTFAFSADGNSEVFYSHGGKVYWQAAGTWGSGTMTLYSSPDGGTTWYKIAAGLTANGCQVTAVTDTLFRFTLSGSTTPALVVQAFPSMLP